MPAIIGSNLAIAVAYAAFGDYAERHQWLPLALTVSVAIPIVVAGLARRWLPEGTQESAEGSTEIDSH